MLISGVYADGLSTARESVTRLRSLGSFLESVLPPEVGLHLLPFSPTSGDWGFAIDDWFAVRDELGDWADVRALGQNRRLVVDGVYNHVGVGHKWVREFVSSPGTASRVLHAYQGLEPDDGPISPRGRPVLRPHEVHGAQWHLWQTFTDAAVDVRLDSDSVLEEIDQHLRLLRANRVWGVRLDAVAYFQKYPGCEIRHNPGVYEIADSIAALVERHGIRVFAQLDCDSDGLQYFGKPTQSHYVVNDFSYSAYLTLAVVSGDAQPLARHLSATAKTPRVCLRAPRTHDGILLRSGLLNTHDRDRLIDAVGSHGVPVRMSGSSPYEINASAPYLYGLAGRRPRLGDVIELVVAVTGMTPGWGYLYLPLLLAHVPEDSVGGDVSDPRSVNRALVPASVLDEFTSSGRASRMWNLLKTLGDQRPIRPRTVP